MLAWIFSSSPLLAPRTVWAVGCQVTFIPSWLQSDGWLMEWAGTSGFDIDQMHRESGADGANPKSEYVDRVAITRAMCGQCGGATYHFPIR